MEDIVMNKEKVSALKTPTSRYQDMLKLTAIKSVVLVQG